MSRRRALGTALPLLLVVSGAACLPGGVASDWRQIRIAPLREFRPQQPRRFQLDNGVVVYLQPDRELPLVSGTALFHGGSEEEPPAKIGLVEIFGEVWRTGGTTSKTGDQLDDYLERRAAKVETYGDNDSTAASFSCLKGDFPDVFSIFLDVLRHPAFRPDKILLAKRQLQTGIARRNDNASSIAGRESAKLAYGATSPLARHAEFATVAAVTRDDLLAWHRRYIIPNNLILGFTGDFDPEVMERRIREAFGKWESGPKPSAPKPEIAPPPPGVYFVSKPDVNQSEIRLVELGTTKRNPDFHALQVMNEILGGGFTSRLFANIRSRRGLAYSVGGGVGTGYVSPGAVRFSVGTKSQSTVAAIRALLSELDRIQREPVSARELRFAKDSIENSFIFQYDAKAKVLRARMRYEFYGYPPDFLERFRAGIRKVTIADVQRVARRYITKEKLRMLVVGKAADFDAPLKTLGKVTTLDVTIPGL